jgi:hypothetical protein
VTGIITQLRICAAALAVLALAGCAATGTTATGTTATGLLVGQLVMEGGAIGLGGQQPSERPIPGTVTFTTAGHRPVSVQAGSSGRFSVTLAPGQYQVAGRSPDIETVGSGGQQEQTCSQPLSATVTARQTTTIAVTCIVP